ncbi:MAG: hypothetical protein E7654_03995 [Ruminococcaceae bacterium]|nr:hypothetical protein [Oscillospiraceae bacterium]
MNTVKIDRKNCRMVAHRGCSGLERENTNAAFVAAANRSYYGIETDIHATLDGEYILYHDDHTGRICIDNMEVEKTTFATLRSLLLTDKDGTKGRSDLRMPTLEEYIGICKKYEKIAVLELKNAFTREQIYEICEKIEALDYMEGVIFISFKHDNLVLLREKYPTQAAQFLTKEYTENLIDRLKAYNLDLDIHYPALTEENIKALHDAGIVVNCWTVDDPAVAEQLVAWGVDYITSNILE